MWSCSICRTGRSNIDRRKMIFGVAVGFAVNAMHCEEIRAQEIWNGSLGDSCSFYGGDSIDKETYTFNSTGEAKEVIERISDSVGLPANFKVLAANVPNAMAVIRDRDRYVLYSEAFVQRLISSSATQWSAWTVLAHEVGHHLAGHTLSEVGSRPAIELQADKFAGFAVSRMGATLEQAQACFRQMRPEGSLTHPGKNARIEAVTLGWRQAQSGKVPAPVDEKPPAPQPPTPSPLPQDVAPETTMGHILAALANNNLNVSYLSPSVAMFYNQQRFAIAQRLQFAGQVVGIQVINENTNPDGSKYYQFGVRFVQTYIVFNVVLMPNGVINFLSFQ